jgi:hypothetical protein
MNAIDYVAMARFVRTTGLSACPAIHDRVYVLTIDYFLIFVVFEQLIRAAVWALKLVQL